MLAPAGARSNGSEHGDSARHMAPGSGATCSVRAAAAGLAVASNAPRLCLNSSVCGAEGRFTCYRNPSASKAQGKLAQAHWPTGEDQQQTLDDSSLEVGVTAEVGGGGCWRTVSDTRPSSGLGALSSTRRLVSTGEMMHRGMKHRSVLSGQPEVGRARSGVVQGGGGGARGGEAPRPLRC